MCGEFTGTDEFPAQRASNAENVSIWWRHVYAHKKADPHVEQTGIDGDYIMTLLVWVHHYHYFVNMLYEKMIWMLQTKPPSCTTHRCVTQRANITMTS